MPAPRHAGLVDKSIDACVAAIEIYNKPVFQYREEAFAILMLNAWELLLKARVLQENKGSLRSIQVWEARINKDGKKGKRLRPKINRAGNIETISLGKAADLVRQFKTRNIDERCQDNLHVLAEIRDTAIHLRHVGAGLGKRIQEVGSAALKNYVRAAEQWFNVDLSRFNFFLMPLAFHSPVAIVESLTSKQPPSAEKLLKYIAELEKQHPSDEKKDFNVTLQVELRLVRTSDKSAITLQISKDANAPKIQISEEDFQRAYPWTYADLTKRLRQRYSDFLENAKYHGARKPLEADDQYCRTRYLVPGNPKTPKTRFYNPNILAEFDKHYKRK